MTSEFRRVRLRYLAEFNPPVPTAVRSLSDSDFRLLPMDAIHEFGKPDEGITKPVCELLSGYSYIDREDVAYAKVTPCFENRKGLLGNTLDGPAFATTEVTVLRPRAGVDQRFLSYVLQSDAFRSPAIASMVGAGGLKRVSESAMRDLKIPAPPLDEQRRIADYLDHETAEIDALIEDERRFIELVEERMLSELMVVTQDPTSPRAALRHVSDIQLGKMLRESSVMREPTPYLRAANIQEWGTLTHSTDTKYMDSNAAERAQLTLERGDVVLVEGGAGYAKSAFIDDPLKGWIFQNHVFRVRPRAGVSDGKYLHYALLAAKLSGQFDVRITQATIPTLSSSKLAALPVIVPTLTRQREIAGELDTRLSADRSLIYDIRQATKLSLERRAALISAAVTGRIDVNEKCTPVVEELESALAEA